MLNTWLTNILQSIVTEPDLLVIQEKNDEMGMLFIVSTTNKKDLGLLIGKSGDHVNAIRVLLRTKGHQENIKASIKILSQ